MLAPHVFDSFLYPVYLKGVALVLAIGYVSSTRIFLAERCEDPGTMEKQDKDGSGSLSG